MSKTYHERVRIQRIIVGIIGILFLSLISCGSKDTTSPSNPDSTPPSAVKDLKVDSFTANQVVLSWTAPSNTGTVYGSNATLSGYLVKYKSGDGAFIEIDEESEGVRLTEALVGTSTTATVTGLRASTDYTFLVAAFHSGNGVISYGEVSTVEETTKTAPAPPQQLRKNNTCAKTNSVELIWDASPGATSYELYRDGSEITGITTNFYTDEGLTSETTYTYTVRACSTNGCSDDSDPLTITYKVLTSLIDSGSISADLINYDERSREIFSRYGRGVPLIAKYLKPGGTNDGSSFFNAAGNLKTVLATITNAAADRVYAVFLMGGNYTNKSSVSMKNHVAIIGGVDECLSPSDTVTILDGEGSYRVFDNNGIDSTALLYGVTIANGEADQGGGMYNKDSSPSLVGVTFSGNTATGDGGGMHNENASPSLVGVTFSGNTATVFGGGMFNENASPSLVGVTFSENTAIVGGGMFNENASPSLVGVTFFSNRAIGDTGSGGGMANDNNGEVGPLIINGIFWGNTANSGGSQFYLFNDESGKENLRIYNSIVEGGTGTLTSGTTNTSVNQGWVRSDGGSAPIVISFANIIDEDPGLLPLADNGGSVPTHAITKTSPAVNRGLYVKKKGSTFYYNADKSTWYTQPDLKTSVTPPLDAVDVTATDATGYTRTDQPDLGAYEAR